MKLIDAIWEKRNLGIRTVEVVFEQTDSPDEINAFLKKIDAEYVVLKLPTYLTHLLPIIQNNGYRYMEDMIYFVSYLQYIYMTPIQRRLYDSITVANMTDQDMCFLYNEIQQGLFDSDRIYLDPHFSHEIAAKRYINWIKDERENATEFLKYVYKGNTIGFFSLKEVENGHYTSFIGGIYKNYRKGGIGAVVKAPEEVRKRNGKKVSTNVSTNNITQVKSLVMNGYVPENIMHTFIKHQ